VANKPITVSNHVTLIGSAMLTHAKNTTTEANKIDLAVGGDFHLDPNAGIDVDELGYNAGSGPGYGLYGRGASHGGEGGWSEQTDTRNTYGSVIAPTNIGSGGSHAGTDGGGAIKLAVTGQTRLYGYLSANGEFAGSYKSGSAGGSIFLTTSTLVGDAALEAEGGGSSAYPAGGGGRIAVILTAGTSFDQVTLKVRGGIGGSSFNGAPGTIYKQTGNQAAGAGTVIVDCQGRAPDSTSLDAATILLPDTGYVPDELKDAMLVVTNAGTHVRVWTNVTVGDLLVFENTKVALGDHVMFVDSREHFLDDISQPDAGGPTNAVDDYSNIIWIGTATGSLLLFQ